MTKGYKATHNYRCRDQTYKVGQEYKLEYKPVVCERGFHYCQEAKDVLSYYYYLSSFKLLEIEDMNPEGSDHRCDKSSSNHIRIIREISDKSELMSLLQIECIQHENVEQFVYFCDSTKFIVTFDLVNRINNVEMSSKYTQSKFVEYTYHKNGQFKSCKNNYGDHCIYTLKGWERC